MKKTLLVFSFFIALFFAQPAKADHVMGADIQWKCIGNDTFRIIFKFYRDCRGIPKSASVSILITSDSCSSSQSFNATLQRTNLVDITPVCQGNKPCNPTNTMLPSIPYGIEEHTFEGNIYLGGARANCCWYKVFFQECCRSGPINTGYSWANFSTEMWLNRCITPCDNGPQFSNPPMAILCAGQDVCFNHGAQDIDGDSLVYKKAIPNGANYSAPWNVNSPLTHLGMGSPNAPLPAGFHLDPISGDLCFRPLQQQETVMKLRVESWRKINGVYKLIGIATRDMHIIVLANCNNKAPTLGGPFNWDACAGQQICFSMASNDQDLTDSTKVSWNRGIPAGTFTTNNGSVRLASGTFCWTPTDNDVSSLPYFFTVTVVDNKCPLNGTNTRAYSVTVYPTPKATRTYTPMGCGKIKFESVPNEAYVNPTYQWTVQGTNYNSQNAIHQFSSGGSYPVRFKITAKGCSRTYFDTIQVDTFVKVWSMNDTVICKGSPILIPTITKWGKQPYAYKWYTGNPADTNSTLVARPLQDTIYVIEVADSTGCLSSDTVKVTVKPLPEITPNPDTRICLGETTTFDAENPGATYIWTKDGVFFASSKTIFAGDSGQYVAHVIDSFGCEAFDTMNLYVNPKVIVGPISDVSICLYDTATLMASGADSYEWTDGTNNYSGSSIKVNPTITTTYYLKGTYTEQGKTCYGFDTVAVIVKPLPIIEFPASGFPERCVNGGPINLWANTRIGGVPVTPDVSNWYCTSRPNAIVSGNLFEPSATAPTGGTFYVTFQTTFNGCSSIDSVQITINPLPIVRAGSDKVFCVNASSYLLDTMAYPFDPKDGEWSVVSAGTPAGTVSTTAAFPGFNYYFNAAVAGVGKHMLRYKYKDANTKCENADTVEFTVNPIPVVDAGVLNDVCVDHGLLDLNVSNNSPKGGVWSGPGVTADYFDPLINNTGLVQTYTLYYDYIAIGCRDMDSVQITVHPLPITKITAVTPMCINAGSINLQAVPNNGGIGIFSGPGVTGNSFDPRVAGPGNHKVKYVFTSSTVPYCDNSDSINITVQDEPKVWMDPIPPLCEKLAQQGITITGGVKAGFGMQWTADSATGFTNATGSPTIYYPSANELANKKVTIKLSSTGNGICAGVDTTVVMDIFPTPSVNITAPELKGCAPFTANFSGITDASAGASFSWDFGDPSSGNDNVSTQQNPVHLYKDPGVYNVKLKVVSADGCEDELILTQFIEVYPIPNAAFEADPAVTTVALTKIKFLNKSTGNMPLVFDWDFGDGVGVSNLENPEYIYGNADTGTYAVILTITSADGCIDTAIRLIYIGPDVTVFIPNAFSPDDQGPTKNNRFYVVADGFKEFNIKIYDRWGEQLYESYNVKEGWDGTYKMQPCQEDVYIYKVKVLGFNDKTYEYYGTITLLR